MAMKIRLARGGSKKRPFYRIVAADSRMPRDGRYVENWHIQPTSSKRQRRTRQNERRTRSILDGPRRTGD